MQIINKQCAYCKLVKPFTEFYNHRGGWLAQNGERKDYRCMECVRSIAKETSGDRVWIGGMYAGKANSLGVPGGRYVEVNKPKKIVKKSARPGQSKFRETVLKRDHGCVVTATPWDTRIYSKGRTKSVVQAAHIKPFKLCTGDEYTDPENGLAMRVDIHSAFDHGLFTIGDEGEIIASRWMQDFYPEKITTKLTDKQRQYLEGHRGWTMGNWSRWAFGS